MKIIREPTVRPYREGDLIALMKEKKIGRPSTYSKIIDILFKRRYIFSKGGAIFNTRLGEAVYDYLAENFESLVSEELTRDLETKIDAVENGQAWYQDIIRLVEYDIRNVTGRSVSNS